MICPFAVIFLIDKTNGEGDYYDELIVWCQQCDHLRRKVKSKREEIVSAIIISHNITMNVVLMLEMH